jgi:hypothetical protein
MIKYKDRNIVLKYIQRMERSMWMPVSYLIHREGEFYEKNTFRFGTGGVSFLNDKLNLEPVIYFHDLFRGVTPGLRLQMAF